MKLNKHNKILIITTASLALLGLIIIILLISKGDKAPEINPNEYLVEVPNFPQSEWWRVIKTQEEKLGYQTATNNYSKYQITVSSKWSVQEKASSAGGLKIFFEIGEFDVADVDESQKLMLRIITYDNPEKLSITDWLRQSSDANQYQNSKFEKVQIGQYAGFRTSMQLFYEGLNNNGNIIELPVENSLKVSYLLKGADNIYAISCVALSDADTLIPLCEKQVQTFEILR